LEQVALKIVLYVPAKGVTLFQYDLSFMPELKWKTLRIRGNCAPIVLREHAWWQIAVG